MRKTWLLALFLGLVWVAGCASKPTPRSRFKPGSGLIEYRTIADTAIQALKSALTAAEAVGAGGERCSPEDLAALSQEVRRLQVDSVQIRAKGQAILERGEGYFQNWHEALASVEDRAQRSLIKRHRQELQRRFEGVKSASGAVRESFGPFLSDLRTFRNSLEVAPASARSTEGRQLLSRVRGRGADLLLHLEGIKRELDAMQRLITP